jgi:hypothetical protein
MLVLTGTLRQRRASMGGRWVRIAFAIAAAVALVAYVIPIG